MRWISLRVLSTAADARIIVWRICWTSDYSVYIIHGKHLSVTVAVKCFHFLEPLEHKPQFLSRFCRAGVKFCGGYVVTTWFLTSLLVVFRKPIKIVRSFRIGVVQDRSCGIFLFLAWYLQQYLESWLNCPENSVSARISHSYPAFEKKRSEVALSLRAEAGRLTPHLPDPL